MFGMMM